MVITISENSGLNNLINSIKKIIEDNNIMFILAIILISFMNAWDFLDLYDNDYRLFMVISTNEYYISITRVIPFLFEQLFGWTALGYWFFFIIHVAFIISFVYIAKKLNVKDTFVYVFLLSMIFLRYGAWDYGIRAIDSMAWLVMVWTYYFYRTNNKKAYYAMSIIGFFTREFCLYVNLYFILESIIIMKGHGSDLKLFYINLKFYIRKMIKEHLFEIILIIMFIPYRVFFYFYGGWEVSSISFMIDKLLEPKVLFMFVLMFGFIWYYILFYGDIRIYLLIIAVSIFSFLFGNIYEVDKLGCLTIIILLSLNVFQNESVKNNNGAIKKS